MHFNHDHFTDLNEGELFDSYTTELFEIEITYDQNWKELDLSLIEKCLNAVLKILPFEVKNFFCLSVLLTNDAMVQSCNKQYREKDKPTNVLSFQGYENLNELIEAKNNFDELVMLGDLLFGYETIMIEINEKNINTNEKITLNQYFCTLCIHGLLHLFGFHHETDEEEDLMNDMSEKAYKIVVF